MGNASAGKVATWIMGRPRGATIDEMQLEFQLTRKRALYLRDYLSDSPRYVTTWSGPDGRPAHTAAVPRLFVHEIKPRKIQSNRLKFYASTLPGQDDIPYVFHGNAALDKEGYLPASVRRARDKKKSYAGYVWTSKPLPGFRYVPVYAKKEVLDAETQPS